MCKGMEGGSEGFSRSTCEKVFFLMQILWDSLTSQAEFFFYIALLEKKETTRKKGRWRPCVVAGLRSSSRAPCTRTSVVVGLGQVDPDVVGWMSTWAKSIKGSPSHPLFPFSLMSTWAKELRANFKLLYFCYSILV